MEYFHNNFRNTWNTLYKACETGKRPAGMYVFFCFVLLPFNDVDLLLTRDT
jgi:hypothetical protein